MVRGGLISIREALHSLTPMEQQAARYMLDYPESAVGCSIQKLAKEADVSEATIIRLAQSLGYQGFKELKLAIVANVAVERSEQHPYRQFQVDGPTESLLESISNNNIKSIKDTLMVLDAAQVEQAIGLLSEARKIAIFGIESSAVIADDFRHKASRLGMWCEVGASEDAQAIIAANLTEGDAVLAISYSGQTEAVLRAMEIAKRRGARLISLTQFGVNPVAQIADIPLFCSTVEKDFRNGAMASRIAQLNVIDMLYVGLVQHNYEGHIETLNRTKEAVRYARNKSSH
ncbi:MurR/RpiR family transcriptional regulator [Paenibacillus sp. GCM10023248]|uniref:MurR/RpiR family transcriptional regulator n=1 Tax=Bacillales TaxID=1385 RepID=UPI002378E8CD|nr:MULTISPECIES: MurR/RpiR family transcriptional regulator [Bacillales]MDD9265613.1 MurR/RpiR family transcriptional regulator [Paenibacillus sp. MAHUQ-63]MDR6878853.1 DNA-binding MurR/RpiR family transcriptional regulator [Bacillus sp. 3255]